MTGIPLGYYPGRASSAPLYDNLQKTGYRPCLLNSLKEAVDFELIIVHGDFLHKELDKIYYLARYKPILLASSHPDMVARAAEWRIEAIIGPHWGPDDLRLVIEFHLKKNRYFPKVDPGFLLPTHSRANILLVEDDALMAEVVAITEHPTVLLGEFDSKFLVCLWWDFRRF